MAWEALAVERMLRNDEEYKEYLEDIEAISWGPCRMLKYFSVKGRDLLSDTEIMLGTWLLLEEEETKLIIIGFDKGQTKNRSFRMSGRQIKGVVF
ncbi:ADI_G0045050.mRNA.1.CDS.1 [Saccharomyces cerevisiae]|nr:ADI_G0045050.mRNA.1.CDS.1 [Saccharomyces cerevisiae]CAI6858703.1 ADI_G0045050.mRNA.1.CDS.1 [Saccharomyces cerevisiae]